MKLYMTYIHSSASFIIMCGLHSSHTNCCFLDACSWLLHTLLSLLRMLLLRISTRLTPLPPSPSQWVSRTPASALILITTQHNIHFIFFFLHFILFVYYLCPSLQWKSLLMAVSLAAGTVHWHIKRCSVSTCRMNEGNNKKTWTVLWVRGVCVFSWPPSSCRVWQNDFYKVGCTKVIQAFIPAYLLGPYNRRETTECRGSRDVSPHRDWS